MAFIPQITISVDNNYFFSFQLQHDDKRGGDRSNDRVDRGGDRNDRGDRGGDRNDRGDRGDRGGDRNHDRGDRGGNNDRKGGFNDRLRKSDEFMIGQKLKQLQGPTHDIPRIDQEEIKFSGRNRLYIGNLTNDITEDGLRELFKPYGEISESFLNAEKNFAFLKVDFRANAERAKRELDGSLRKNRPLRVRFAPNATTLKVRNLTLFVSNELLHKAFEVFGNVSAIFNYNFLHS